MGARAEKRPVGPKLMSRLDTDLSIPVENSAIIPVENSATQITSLPV